MKRETKKTNSESCTANGRGALLAGAKGRWGRALFGAVLCSSVALGCGASGGGASASDGDGDDESEIYTEGLTDEDLQVLESSYTESELAELDHKATNKKGCSSSQKSEIDSGIAFIAARWSAYERAVERETGLNIKNCLENRFKDNGKYHCESKTVHGCNSTLLGRNNFLSNVAHICPNGMRQITARSTFANRRASYTALLAHEWAHSCARNEKNSDKIDLATFNFFKSVDPAVTDGSCVSCNG